MLLGTEAEASAQLGHACQTHLLPADPVELLCCLQILYYYPAACRSCTVTLLPADSVQLPWGHLARHSYDGAGPPLLLPPRRAAPAAGAYSEHECPQRGHLQPAVPEFRWVLIHLCHEGEELSGVPPNAFKGSKSTGTAITRKGQGAADLLHALSSSAASRTECQTAFSSPYKSRQLMGGQGCCGDALVAGTSTLATEQAEEDTHPSLFSYSILYTGHAWACRRRAGKHLIIIGAHRLPCTEKRRMGPRALRPAAGVWQPPLFLKHLPKQHSSVAGPASLTWTPPHCRWLTTCPCTGVLARSLSYNACKHAHQQAASGCLAPTVYQAAHQLSRGCKTAQLSLPARCCR